MSAEDAVIPPEVAPSGAGAGASSGPVSDDEVVTYAETVAYVVRVRHLPWQVRVKDVRNFFEAAGIPPVDGGVVLVHNATCEGYVAFLSEDTRAKAIRKSKEKMAGK
jgi:hypothetical protein